MNKNNENRRGMPGPLTCVKSLAAMMAYAAGAEIEQLAARHKCSPDRIREMIYNGLAEADLDGFLMLCTPKTHRIGRNALMFVRQDSQRWLTAGKAAVRLGVALVAESERPAVAELAREYSGYLDIFDLSETETKECG